MNSAYILNFDENEVEEICNSETCFLQLLKTEKSEAESYLNFVETM
jgi:hypothetical protein